MKLSIQYYELRVDMKKIKCIVWDLDNTLWDGTLTEDLEVSLFPGVIEIIKTLDERGILQSIASKNDYDVAMKQLEAFGLETYFIYPQISWNSKGDAIKKIVDKLNIGMDTIAFIDDRAIERAEVEFMLPDVECIDVSERNQLLNMDRLTPRFITEDSKRRRQMYLNDIKRNEEEEQFSGSNQEFLNDLDMTLTLSPVKLEDLKRVEELTLRTNQLNSTGYTYDYDTLVSFIDSNTHIFLAVQLKDRFGHYGKVGICLLEHCGDALRIKLLLMSCRVMSKGIGSAMLTYVIRRATEEGKRLEAEFLETDRNRMMYITYKMAGFEEVGTLSVENGTLLAYQSSDLPDYPEHLEMIFES